MGVRAVANVVVVGGVMAWAGLVANQVSITVQDSHRVIVSNGIPDHEPGQFPSRGNPHTISPQHHQYRVPLHPEKAAQVRPVPPNPFGVALNGVPFDPGTAEFWRNDRRSGWNYDALSGKINLGMDRHNAHVQPGGVYHYHGIPTGLIEILSREDQAAKMTLVGYAADGFPVYGPQAHRDPHDVRSPLQAMTSSYRLKRGERNGGPGGEHDGTFVQDWEYVAGAGDLDECNGRDGVTPEYPEGTYYYVLTDTFPFIPRYYRGTPDASFERKGPPPGGPRPFVPPPGRRPPPPR